MVHIKSYIQPLLLGLAILGIMFLVMTRLTIDFRIVLIVGSLLMLLAGRMTGKNKLHPLILTFLVAFPFSLILSVLTFSQLPQVTGYTLFYFLAAWMGVSIRSGIDNRKSLALFLYGIFILFIAFKIVPTLLDYQLSQEINKTIETFIRETPEQYQWSYKRFKKRPPGETRFY